MNAKLIAAALSLAASTAFAADTPAAAPAAAVKTVAASQAVSMAAATTLPAIEIKQDSGRTRAEVHAEAVAYLATRKSTLAEQLEQYK
ncbi:hypothetical protein [Massilia sp. TS11]|uniref:hypothetical protein n=1 Tax=Massilia sp. TS11 TaxID=2908003 RepID=UPI001EDAE913|nr:hypothetical protein [Massilia sp. TS11]MCG2585657.1 hypothetical protein [Massilia sp. TS11]